MEHSFWSIDRHSVNSNIVELFKKSFTLYVESGMKEMTERDLGVVLRNEQGELACELMACWPPETKEKFYKFIFDHYLRKFHCFYLYSTHLITIIAY